MSVSSNVTRVEPEAPEISTSGVASKFKLLTAQQILELPSPTWLIEDTIEAGALGVLYGPSGEGKSFVALDWALCVATGRPWQGKATRKGPVVYVVAEGGRGIKKRVAAWLLKNDTNPTDAFFLLEAVQLKDPADYTALVQALDAEKLAPALIVLDTFARCFTGGDENTSKDVGQFIDAATRLQTTTRASVLLIHHTGKAGESERGSSALRAAADAMFKVSRAADGVIVVKNNKQKDEEQAADVRLRLEEILLQLKDEILFSCVLVAANAAADSGSLAPLNTNEEIALFTLKKLERASSGSWRAAVGEAIGRPELSSKSFDNWRKELVRRKLVEATGIGGGHRAYQLTDTGLAFATGTPSETQDPGPASNASHATTPEGVGQRHEGGVLSEGELDKLVQEAL